MGNSRFEQSFVSFYLIFWSVVLAIELSVIIKRKPDVWKVVIVDEQLNMGNSRFKQTLYLFISFFEVLFLQLGWVSSLNGNLMSGRLWLLMSSSTWEILVLNNPLYLFISFFEVLFLQLSWVSSINGNLMYGRLWSLMSSSSWETLVINKLCIFLSHFLKCCSCNWVECHH